MYEYYCIIPHWGWLNILGWYNSPLLGKVITFWNAWTAELLTNIYFRSTNHSLIPILLEKHRSLKTKLWPVYLFFVNELCEIGIYMLLFNNKTWAQLVGFISFSVKGQNLSSNCLMTSFIELLFVIKFKACSDTYALIVLYSWHIGD
jgi:hypothetical protein